MNNNFMILLKNTCTFVYLVSQMHVNCSKAECNFSEEDKFLSYRNQKIQIPFYEQIDRLDNDFHFKNKTYLETYKNFENSRHVVISFGEMSEKGVMELISKIKGLLPEKLEEHSFKIHAELDTKNYSKINNFQAENLHKFFILFSNIFLNNEKYFDNTNDLEYEHYDTKILSHRNAHLKKLENILNIQNCNKYIILDECCDDNKKSYEVIFKLLFCAFLHKPVHSNFLILCINDIKDKGLETFELNLLQLYDCKDFICKNIFYTKLNCANNIYKIQMRCSMSEKEIDTSIKSFIDVVEFNNDLLYKIFPCSINSRYDYMLGRFDEDLKPCQFIDAKDNEKTKFICCVFTIKNLQSSYKIYFTRKLNKSKLNIMLNFYIWIKDTTTNEKPKLIDQFYYQWVLASIAHIKNYHRNVNKASESLKGIFEFINKNLQYNPFFAEFSLINLYIANNDINIEINKGCSLKIRTNYNSMLQELSKIINVNPYFDSTTRYAEVPIFEIDDINEIKYYDFFPYENDLNKNGLKPKWNIPTELDVSKMSQLLNNCLLLQINCNNRFDYTYYIKIRADNLISPVDDSRCNKSIRYQIDCKLFVKTNIFYIKNEKSFTKYTVDNLISLLQGMSTLMFEDYTNLDHFICMNNLKLRSNYINQIVHYYFLINLPYDLISDDPDIFRKNLEISKIKDLVKKILQKYQKNAYLIDDEKNKKYIEFSKEFLQQVQNLYKHENLIAFDPKMFAILFKKFYNSLCDEIYTKKYEEEINFEISIITPNVMPCHEIEKIRNFFLERFSMEINN